MRLIICPKTGLFRAFLYLKPPKRRLKLIFSLYLFSKKKIKKSSERGKNREGKTISGKIRKSVSFSYGRPEIRIWKSIS